LFPNIVFRLKKGGNFEPGDPNHDLFQLAMKVAARRMNPTFSLMDASFNRPYGDEVAYMGCRTRVMGNRRGSEVAAGRGNIAPVTMNLPGLALRARTPERFMLELDDLVALAGRQVLHRYRVLCSLKARELPFLMGQGLYLDSGALGPDDAIEPALRHGTLAIGFIGLAEALTALTGRHHGESDESLQLGLKIVGRVRELTDGLSREHDLNVTCYATPAEGLAGRFTLLDRETFGRVRGVTDSDFYTNSFHVPVACPLGAFEKMEREAPFHRLCNAGHISYVELPSAPEHNIAAVEKLLKRLAELDAGYAGINFPIDECRACGRRGLQDGACASCGSTDIRRIRRVTGYLSTEDRFNAGKRAELKARIPHRL
ncbi:MAG: anaerobic ribonucleoside-triphosphate reductase, partial [Elusimicrobia bacterium]|nr:anaerobic ribonucleoside-triphosphate reductase [Elusimicrobiota bacterium]